MEKNEAVKRLNDLIKLDIDASHAYDQAIKEIDVTAVKDRITSFRDDHLRHVQDLSRLVRDMGGQPAEHTRDFKGYLIEGFTALRSKTGTAGALKAMKTNEQLTNKKYGDARSAGFDQTAMSVIEKNYDDEKRHLQYIEEAIREHT